MFILIFFLLKKKSTFCFSVFKFSLKNKKTKQVPFNFHFYNMPLKLTTREHAPVYSQHDYPYIQRGFILPHYNLLDGFDTITFISINNETANVWTQLAGLFCFVLMFVTVALIPTNKLINPREYTKLAQGHEDEIETRRWWYLMSVVCAIICCASSTLAHTFQARSQNFHKCAGCLDYNGIAMIPLGICMAVDLGADLTELLDHHMPSKWVVDFLSWSVGPTHFAFTIAIFVGLLLFLGFGSHHTNHTARFILFFVAMVGTLLPFIFLYFYLFPIKSTVSILSMLLGGFFFSSHLPERKYPKIFDIIMPSHALWHIFYQLCILIVYDNLAAMFFGQPTFTSENLGVVFKKLAEYLVVLV
jgi:predicted membrane channel-forming protein YqfA (hemolysin III family)